MQERHHKPEPSPPVVTTAQTYTFEDEFAGAAGSAPNPALWTYDLGGGGWGNGELETYTDSRVNSYLDGEGHLVIAATKTASGYQSARLKTQGLFAQTGGYFEASIQLNPKTGVWPAFWMLGADIGSVGWPQCGEVDLMENYGGMFTETTVHVPHGSSTYTVAETIASDDNFHTYQCYWDTSAETFTFSRDGSAYLTVSESQFPAGSWPYDRNGGMFFLLNIAVGGDAVGSPGKTTFPVTMLVDYVRAWQ